MTKSHRPGPDARVYAMIDAHKAARQAFSSVLTKIGRLETALMANPATHDLRLDVPRNVMLRPGVPFSSREAIDAYINQHFSVACTIAGKVITNARVSTMLIGAAEMARREMHAEYSKAVKAHREKQRKTGWLALERARDKACDAEMAAFESLCRARPGTISGLLAQLTYLRSLDGGHDITDRDSGAQYLGALQAALRKIAKVQARPPADVVPLRRAA